MLSRVYFVPFLFSGQYKNIFHLIFALKIDVSRFNSLNNIRPYSIDKTVMITPQSLSELSLKIKNIIDNSFPFSVPVIAEISDLNINKNGICYVELIEHDTKKSSVVARVRGIIFANRFNLIQSYFLSVTGIPVQAGITVLIIVKVSYHEIYGLSVEIVDIDPKYTLGDLEQQKKLAIERLLHEGVIDMNKNIELPPIIKRVAVISSATAAGYDDFIQHLSSNPFGFSFKADIYEAYMQGQQTINSINTAIDNIFASGADYDIIVIIRGGGSKMELAVFDNYDLAYLITQLPIPVFTGIGHERDEAVVDLVANNAFKTPTAVANFIIDHNKNFEEYLKNIELRLQNSVTEYLTIQHNIITSIQTKLHNYAVVFYNIQKEAIAQAQSKITRLSLNYLNNNNNKIAKIKSKLQYSCLSLFLKKQHQLQRKKQYLLTKAQYCFITQQTLLQIKEQKILNADPQKILNKGYAIITKNGKKIKDVNFVEYGDKVNIILGNGSVPAEILKKRE